ncbi:MAG: hypothetical protein KGS72_13095 [Cyanobacteria bacterium REEB67]|nr:hypothetical protein [Cyanobacteria bacterium REEB67]
MPDEHRKESTDKFPAGIDKIDERGLQVDRSVSAGAIDSAENKRTNASDGRMNRFQKVGELEPSVEINFGSTVVSRRNAVTESQISGRHDQQLLAQAAAHSHNHKSKGAEGIASTALDLHQHHSEDFRNHSNAYTCAGGSTQTQKLVLHP